MTDWPDDWFRDGGSKAEPAHQSPTPHGPGLASPFGRQASGEPQTNPRMAAPNFAASAGRTEAIGAGPAQPGGQPPSPASAWPEQPPQRIAGGPPWGRLGGGFPGGPGSGWRRWLRPRPIFGAIAVVLSLILIGAVASYFYVDSKIVKKDVLINYPGRPAPGAGTNWLITGSDSRQGLTRAQERRLATGHDISGQRSDTIMVLHLPASGGRPVLISLPRDSWVPIPGHGYAKINAAYTYGGPQLLAETVQNVTGLYINHYMGIGFGGFVHVVDAIGGVRICLKRPLVDRSAGLHLPAGCQALSGAEALGYVRSRHTYATQDLQRIQNQRIFLRALLRKLTSAGVIANPFRSFPAASGVAGSLTVDSGTSLYQLLQVAFALRNPITTTVPIANSNYLVAGQDALEWNRALARQLFGELYRDQPISKDLITGSQQGG